MLPICMREKQMYCKVTPMKKDPPGRVWPQQVQFRAFARAVSAVVKGVTHFQIKSSYLWQRQRASHSRRMC